MNRKSEHGTGTVRVVHGRDGKLIGYQPLLPREMSRIPPGVQHRRRYQEPLGSPLPTWEEARRLLDAAIVELRSRRFDPEYGLPLSAYARQAINGKRNTSFGVHRNASKADKDVSTWKSVNKLWLARAPFYDDPPGTVETVEIQRWVNWLQSSATSAKGGALSSHFIRHIGSLLTAAFEAASVTPNPMLGVKMPPKAAPRVPHLDRAAQELLFGSDIPLEDRVMIGCGMGAGLRVGELLSMEVADIDVSSNDPHLLVRYGGPNQQPTKGRKVRPVELFEPGLGFWRIWLERFHQGGARVFGGPRGGYLKPWPEQFQGWAERAGKRSMTSHIMRHTYAVSMLSGTWGYEPVGLDFVSKQLGHADRQTTERYYGAFEPGTWRREVRRFTGRSDVADERSRVTAAGLLGLESHDSNFDGATQDPTPFLAGKAAPKGRFPSSTQSYKSTEKQADFAADLLQALTGLAEQSETALLAVQEDRAGAVAKLIEVARGVLELEASVSSQVNGSDEVAS
jgi:integrase